MENKYIYINIIGRGTSSFIENIPGKIEVPQLDSLDNRKFYILDINTAIGKTCLVVSTDAKYANGNILILNEDWRENIILYSPIATRIPLICVGSHSIFEEVREEYPDECIDYVHEGCNPLTALIKILPYYDETNLRLITTRCDYTFFDSFHSNTLSEEYIVEESLSKYKELSLTLLRAKL